MPSPDGSSVGSTLLSAKKLAGMLPGGGATRIVRLTVVEAVRLPDVPVIVTVLVPVGAELLTVKVRSLVDEVLEGLNEAFTPGKLKGAKLTLPENPPAGVILMVLDPLAACCKVTFAGDAESLKLGTGGRMFACAPAPAQPDVPSKRANSSKTAPAPEAHGDRMQVQPSPSVDNFSSELMKCPLIRTARHSPVAAMARIRDSL